MLSIVTIRSLNALLHYTSVKKKPAAEMGESPDSSCPLAVPGDKVSISKQHRLLPVFKASTAGQLFQAESVSSVFELSSRPDPGHGLAARLCCHLPNAAGTAAATPTRVPNRARRHRHRPGHRCHRYRPGHRCHPVTGTESRYRWPPVTYKKQNFYS